MTKSLTPILVISLLCMTVPCLEAKKSKGLGTKAKVGLGIAGGAAAGVGVGVLAANAGNNFGHSGYGGHRSRLSCYQCESRFSQDCDEISWSTATTHCAQLGDNCVKITEIPAMGGKVSLVIIDIYVKNHRISCQTTAFH